MKFLSLFTGRTVRFGGLVLAVLFAVLTLRGIHRIGYLAALVVAVSAWIFPKLWQWLANFADPKYWPAFVGISIAALFAAHAGGWAAVLSCLGLFAGLDGIYFQQNY